MPCRCGSSHSPALGGQRRVRQVGRLRDRACATARPAPATAGPHRSRAACVRSAATTPASTRAASAGSAAAVRSSSTSAPSRRRRRDSTAPVAASNPLSTVSVQRATRSAARIERGGQADPRRGLQVEARDDEQGGAGELVGRRQLGAAAAGEPERADLAAPLRDPVRERRRQQRARLAVGRRPARAAACGIAPPAAGSGSRRRGRSRPPPVASPSSRSRMSAGGSRPRIGSRSSSKRRDLGRQRLLLRARPPSASSPPAADARRATPSAAPAR